jgi:hypothetical protein
MDGIAELVVRVERDERGASIYVGGRWIHPKNFVGVIQKFVLQVRQVARLRRGGTGLES